MRSLQRLSSLSPFILLLLVTAQAGEVTFFQPMKPPRAFQVIAHRGAAGQAPENTRAALLRCIEDGLEWAEVDLRLTRDHQHVLAHDEVLVDGDGRKCRVADHTLEELRQLDLGVAFAARFAGERILALPEALALAKGRLNLYLDAKETDPERLAAAIREAQMESQVIVYDQPDRLRRLHPAAGGGLALMTKWHPGLGLPAWAKTNHLAVVEIDAHEITSSAVQAFHAIEVKVQVKCLGDWDRREFWDRAIDAGADYLQTDLPEEVLAHALWRTLKQRPVRFSLHRGANRYVPENTLLAFEKAVRLGADFVEFDVRTTRDGHFYLLHDSTLDGKTSGHGPIAQLSAREVAALSAGVIFARRFESVRLPTLDEFLTAMAGRVDLYFDAKDIAPEALVAALERHGVTDRTVIYQSPDYLERLRALNPRLKLMPPLGSPAQLDALAQRLKPYAVDTDWDILSKDLIEHCHALGIKVFSDALGSHERIDDYLRAMDWGIDVIQTDHPLRVMRAMEVRTAQAGR